ncbi:MAG: hypothetical protein FIB04_00240 [Gammaproteobacteria bacterium]|nr:hypothetical protein [Gammaproteobacteria bacterium]
MSKSLYVRALALLLVAALAALAAGCGGGEEKAAKKESAAAGAEAGKASAAGAGKQAGAAGVAKAEDDGMANAVAMGKTAAAVDLKYDMSVKPDVGQPFEVELAFIPRVAAEALEVEASGMAGLVLASGSKARFENVVAGERYVAKMLVQVNQPGLYYIGVTAKMVSKVQAEARTFSVPIVVGTVLPAEQKPSPAAAAPGATVKSMQAVETATPAEQKK